MTPSRVSLLSAGLAIVFGAFGQAGHSAQVRASVNPLGTISAVLNQPKPVKVWQSGKITAEIDNRTGVRLTDLEVTLHLDATGLAFETTPTVFLADLDVDRSTKTKWTIRAERSGVYVIVVTVDAKTLTGWSLHTESVAGLLRVKARQGS